MSWEKVKLGDVSESCLGKMLDKRKNKGFYKPYLANVNVRWGAFDLENLQEMRFEDDEDERYGIKYGDLIICEGGEPGRCAIWKEELPNMKIQKALHRVRVKEEMDCRYVYYWFLLAGKQGALKQYYTGATIMHMPEQKLKEVIIDKPPLDVQRKIGNYLESFDNLIENNQKQIKLLEEAAQRLYKEWFVDLRFPGYEDTPIVDGVPEGWAMMPLSSVFEYVRGKSYTSKELVEEGGVVMINLKNIRAFGGYNRNAEKRYEGKFKENQELFAGDIVMGVTDMTKERRLVGHVAIVPDLDETMTFSMDLVTLVPLCVKKSFLYSTMFYGGYSKRISPLANGVNVLHLKPETMMNMEMLVPTEEIMEQYDILFDIYQKKIETLQKQCDIATEARERLLPKLMSGEIEV